MENEMIGRVAEVVAAGISNDLPSADIARAAIEAMREPTEAMADAYWDAADALGDRTENCPLAKEAWAVMIDAALA